MSDSISPRDFRAAAGTADWRVVGDGARAYFTTGTFRRGVEFIAAIDRIAHALDHHPDVDLRYAGVAVRLISHDVGDISERDVELARRISAARRSSASPPTRPWCRVSRSRSTRSTSPPCGRSGRRCSATPSSTTPI